MNSNWSPEMLACWDRLIRHEFDDPEQVLSFTDRLARDNGWTTPYAAQVIEEYRRFCFLAVHAGHPVTPSDAVDQAWHLHLAYTRDYWECFCPDVLRSSLHHGPTKGGTEEDGRYRDWYTTTLDSYDRFFSTHNAEVWPKPDERFADASRFVRLNTADVRIIAPSVIMIAAAISGTIFGIAGIIALTGSKIALGFALAAALVTVLLVLALPAQRRGKGPFNANGCGGGTGCGSGGNSGCGSGCGGGGCGGGG